jgi:hypothetical protein
MKITINSILTVFIVMTIFISCSDKKTAKDEQNDKLYIIDTTVTINGLETKITVEKKEDSSTKIIVSDELDAGNSEVVENTDTKFTHYSMEYLVSFEDKNGKSKSSINLDLISELNKSSKLENEIGPLKGQIISDGILFDGIAQNELLIFKINTWDGGESGGEWTIGVVKDKNTTIENAPCVLMAYDRSVGEDFHYKNNKFFIGQFMGYWNLSADKENRQFIHVETKGTGTGYAFANRGISLKHKLDDKNKNKLLLYLAEGNYYGQGMADGYDIFYSTTQPYAELIYNPEKPEELTLTIFGLYDDKLKKYIDEGEKNKIQAKRMKEEDASF